jgi:hypothetical protein
MSPDCSVELARTSVTLPRSALRVAGGLFLFVQAVYLLAATCHVRGQDQEYYYRIARSIAREHTFAIEPLVFQNKELAGARGFKMNRQRGAMQKPRGNRGGADQHASVSREQSSEDRRTKDEDAAGDAQELIECAREDQMRVQFERDQTRNGAGAERAENPGVPTSLHARFIFAKKIL